MLFRSRFSQVHGPIDDVEEEEGEGEEGAGVEVHPLGSRGDDRQGAKGQPDGFNQSAR